MNLKCINAYSSNFEFILTYPCNIWEPQGKSLKYIGPSDQEIREEQKTITYFFVPHN